MVFKVTWWLASLVAVGGELFLGFTACGGKINVGLGVSITVFVASIVAIVARWKTYSNSKTKEYSVMGKIFRIIAFTTLLFLACIVFNAIGWVLYYSPDTAVEAIREFQHGIYGVTC